MCFLVNASPPKQLDVAILNFVPDKPKEAAGSGQHFM